MKLNLSRLSRFIAPTAGVVYVILWWVAEAGRLGNSPVQMAIALMPLFVFGLVIGISQRWSAVALGLMGAVLVLQLLVGSARFTSTSWPA